MAIMIQTTATARYLSVFPMQSKSELLAKPNKDRMYLTDVKDEMAIEPGPTTVVKSCNKKYMIVA